MNEDFEDSSSAVKELTAAIRNLISANNDAAEAARIKAEEDKKAAKEAAEQNKIDNNYKATKQKLKDSGEKLVTEFNKIAEAGIKLASSLGTQATQGIQLELKNRIAAIRSLASLDANTIASKRNIEAVQQSISQAFVNVGEGLQFSADGARKFSEDLNRGFKSEFQPTAESIRALAQMGITTTAQMDAFRRATGRASLTGNQLAGLYSKNTLSFLLYGNSFAKAAAQAERLGVNLASIQGAQESLVTNLDGTIDTVAQLNQLGANIDFGSLVRIAEQEGPDALMAYIRATVPDTMMLSASSRALFKQLGISVEDFKKSGGVAASGADEMEKRLTEQAQQTGAVSNAMGVLAKAIQTAQDTFGGLIVAAVGLTAAFITLGAAGIGAAAAGVAAGLATLSVALIPVLAIMGGLGLIASGKSVAEQSKPKAFVRGAGGGALISSAILATLGLAGAIPTGGLSLGAALAASGFVGGGALLGGLYAANDMFSAGYGTRTLVTPKGAFALNNADDIIAGTNLFPKGALRAGSDNTELMRKIDTLITAISSANTTISVGGVSQTVPRIQLVGVYSRNEVR